MAEEPRSGVNRGLSSIGFELVAAVAGFTAVGYGWDRYFGTAPWGLLIGALLGLTGGMYNLIRQSLRATRGMAGSGREKIKTTNGDRER